MKMYGIAAKTKEGYVYFVGEGPYDWPLRYENKNEAYESLERTMVNLNNTEGPIYRRVLTPVDMKEFSQWIDPDPDCVQEPDRYDVVEWNNLFSYDYVDIKTFKSFYVSGTVRYGQM